MPAAKLRLMPDLLEEHFEELQFLWGQRRSALRSPLYTARELLDQEERIEAHVQGLLVAGDQLIPLVEEGLASDDPLLVFASTYVLLRLNTEAAIRRAGAAFAAAEGGGLQGASESLCN